MKKLVVTGPAKTEVIDAEMPTYKDHEVLIKIKYYGVCQSEHYSWLHAKAGNGVNVGMGHEPMGVVAAVGKNVKKVKVGDRVTGTFSGGIAEYNVAGEEGVFLIPDNVADEDAIGEPLGCLLSAVSKVPMTFPGESSVCVVGCGYMGCGAISLLKLRGAGKIVAVDIRRESLENALRYGADEAYLVDEIPQKYIADCRHYTAPEAFDYVMEWGETDDSLNIAIKLTKLCGFLALGAYHTGPSRCVEMQLMNLKALTCVSTHPREWDLLKKGMHNALQLLSSGQWNYQNLPVKIYPMNGFDRAHEELESKYGTYMKAIIDCTKFDGEPVLKG